MRSQRTSELGVWRLADDRAAGGLDDGDEHRRVDRAGLQVGVPVPARAELVPRVVAVHEVDPAGDGLDPVHDPDQVLARRVGVAGVEAEADVLVSPPSPTASQSLAMLSRLRAIAPSPPAVFSISMGSGRSISLDRLAPAVVAFGRVGVDGHVPAVHDQPCGADRTPLR